MATAPARAALLHDSRGWFGAARLDRAEARRRGRCVECGEPTGRPRAVYCSRTCSWRYHGRFFWDSARTYVLHRDRFTCRECRRRLRRRELDVDHIVEIAAGGRALDYANLQTLCRSCHRGKTVRFLTARRVAGGPSGPDEVEWFPA